MQIQEKVFEWNGYSGSSTSEYKDMCKAMIKEVATWIKGVLGAEFQTSDDTAGFYSLFKYTTRAVVTIDGVLPSSATGYFNLRIGSEIVAPFYANKRGNVIFRYQQGKCVICVTNSNTPIILFDLGSKYGNLIYTSGSNVKSSRYISWVGLGSEGESITITPALVVLPSGEYTFSEEIFGLNINLVGGSVYKINGNYHLCLKGNTPTLIARV